MKKRKTTLLASRRNCFVPILVQRVVVPTAARFCETLPGLRSHFLANVLTYRSCLSPSAANRVLFVRLADRGTHSKYRSHSEPIVSRCRACVPESRIVCLACLTMTVHWETSKKPLFVKTIWTDGHHHAVLHEQDPFHDQKPKTQRNASAVKKSRKFSTKSAPLAKSTAKSPKQPNIHFNVEFDHDHVEECDELTISTVRIPLTTFRKSVPASESPKLVYQRRDTRQQQDDSLYCDRELRRVYTIDVVPTDVIKCQVFDPFQSFQQENTELQTHRLTTQQNYESRYNRQHNADFTCRKLFETPRDTTLTDRVLVWLDLAKNTNLPIQKPQHSNVTNIVRVKMTSNLVANQPNVAAAIKNRYVRVDESRTPSPSTSEDATSSANDYARTIEEPALRRVVEPRLQINSVVETDCYPPVRARPAGNANGFAHDTIKRQLHIFLPDVIKKPDCDSASAISSRISSIS